MTPRSPLIRSAAVCAAVLAVTAATAATAAVAAVQDPLPITPNTYFSGLVNGLPAQGQIQVVCATAAAVGHPAPGQSVEAVVASTVAGANAGYTGTAAHALTVQIATESANPVTPIGTVSLIGVLTGFYENLAIPTTITLPCTGTGVVSFSPTPTSPTAQVATVQVKLVPAAVATPGARPRG
jgi:hypothetical protein